MSKLLLAMPALPAAAVAAQSQDAPKPSAFASCIAAAESALDADERARLEKSLAGMEQSLKAIRDFKLPPDTDPALRFSAMKSRRRGA